MATKTEKHEGKPSADENDFEELYVGARVSYLQAPTVASKKFYGFEVLQYLTVGKLKHETVARLRKQAYAKLNQPTVH